MAKTNMVEREKRRAKIVKKYAAKRTLLKELIRSPKSSPEVRADAQAKLQKLPRDASRARPCLSWPYPMVPYLRNGKLKASSRALPCLLSFAVVVIVMSMPRSWSIWSYWISGKMICSLMPRL